MEVKNKICHITTVHPSTDVRIFHKMCISLAKKSEFEVHLVVPNTESKLQNDVRIHSFESKFKNRRKRIKSAGKKALEIASKLNASIYHLHDPELLFIALKLKKTTGAKIIFDSHEDVPKQILDKIWIQPIQRKLISWLYAKYERRICSKLDGIISVTPIICKRFKSFNNNVELIANYPDKSEFSGIPKRLDFRKEIAYVGGIFKKRGIIELIQAIENIDVQLHLAGSFESDSLKEEVSTMQGWQKVNYLGTVGRNEIKEILSKSEIGIVTLHPTRSYFESYPIKLFEYMATSNAILLSDFPLWRNLIEEYDCCEFVDPLNVEEISNKLNKMLNNEDRTRKMGSNGFRAIQEKYNWQEEFEKLFKFYMNLLKLEK